MKAKRTIRQNRPEWRKKRSWRRKAIRTKRGLKKRPDGTLVFQNVKVKTLVWEEVEGVTV